MKQGYYDVKRGKLENGWLYLDGVALCSVDNAMVFWNLWWVCRNCTCPGLEGRNTMEEGKTECKNCGEDRDPDYLKYIMTYVVWKNRLIIHEAHR